MRTEGEDSDDEEAYRFRNFAGPSKDAMDKFEQHGKYSCSPMLHPS